MTMPTIVSTTRTAKTSSMSIVLVPRSRTYPSPLFAPTNSATIAAVAAIVDNIARPIIYRRFSAIHPLITLIGAVAGVSYFGLMGLLIGPLALSYFFELIRMYREEYLEPEAAT